jgi:hypothetical protein
MLHLHGNSGVLSDKSTKFQQCGGRKTAVGQVSNNDPQLKNNVSQARIRDELMPSVVGLIMVSSMFFPGHTSIIWEPSIHPFILRAHASGPLLGCPGDAVHLYAVLWLQGNVVRLCPVNTLTPPHLPIRNVLMFQCKPFTYINLIQQ